MECPNCHEYMCLTCIKQSYLLSTAPIRCVNPKRNPDNTLVCGVEFTWAFKIENFEPEFLAKEYVDHTTELFISRRNEDIVSIQRSASIRQAFEKICLEIYKLRNKLLAHPYDTELATQLNVLIREKMQHYEMAAENMRSLAVTSEVREMATESKDREMITKVPLPKFIVHCSKEGCTGFYGASWTCTACFSKGCDICHEAKEENHTCNPDTVANLKVISSVSKPCPKCGVSIIKSGGCGYMFCMSCKTAFSWNTGEIQTWSINSLWVAYRNANREQVLPPVQTFAPGPYVDTIFYLDDELAFVSDIDMRDRTMELVIVDHAMGKINFDTYKRVVRHHIDDTRIREVRRFVIELLKTNLMDYIAQQPKKMEKLVAKLVKRANYYLQTTGYIVTEFDDGLEFHLDDESD